MQSTKTSSHHSVGKPPVPALRLTGLGNTAAPARSDSTPQIGSPGRSRSSSSVPVLVSSDGQVNSIQQALDLVPASSAATVSTVMITVAKANLESEKAGFISKFHELANATGDQQIEDIRKAISDIKTLRNNVSLLVRLLAVSSRAATASQASLPTAKERSGDEKKRASPLKRELEEIKTSWRSLYAALSFSSSSAAESAQSLTQAFEQCSSCFSADQGKIVRSLINKLEALLSETTEDTFADRAVTITGSQTGNFPELINAAKTALAKVQDAIVTAQVACEGVHLCRSNDANRLEGALSHLWSGNAAATPASPRVGLRNTEPAQEKRTSRNRAESAVATDSGTVGKSRKTSPTDKAGKSLKILRRFSQKSLAIFLPDADTSRAESDGAGKPGSPSSSTTEHARQKDKPSPIKAFDFAAIEWGPDLITYHQPSSNLHQLPKQAADEVASIESPRSRLETDAQLQKARSAPRLAQPGSSPFAVASSTPDIGGQQPLRPTQGDAMMEGLRKHFLATASKAEHGNAARVNAEAARVLQCFERLAIRVHNPTRPEAPAREALTAVLSTESDQHLQALINFGLHLPPQLFKEYPAMRKLILLTASVGYELYLFREFDQ